MLLFPLFDQVLPARLAHFLACGVVFAWSAARAT